MYVCFMLFLACLTSWIMEHEWPADTWCFEVCEVCELGWQHMASAHGSCAQNLQCVPYVCAFCKLSVYSLRA